MGFRFTCAVTLRSLSRIACRKPVFIERAITSVVTPAATPITASSVTIRKTAGRFGERKYRSATSHSNVILLHRSSRRQAALQRHRLRFAARETGLLRGLYENRSGALRDDRFPRLRPLWEATHAKARECNRRPL